MNPAKTAKLVPNLVWYRGYWLVSEEFPNCECIVQLINLWCSWYNQSTFGAPSRIETCMDIFQSDYLSVYTPCN